MLWREKMIELAFGMLIVVIVGWFAINLWWAAHATQRAMEESNDLDGR